jgi:hypothetical protein
MPLRPLPWRAPFLDLLISKRRRDLQVHRERTEAEFLALREAWNAESAGDDAPLPTAGTLLAERQRVILAQHRSLLDAYGGDVERFLINAPIKLAKYETDYSWEFEAKRDIEIDRLLGGLLAGKQVQDSSLSFLARCGDLFPTSYSRRFLKEELERKFNQARSAPRPAFQLTLDYARRLSGPEFEEWVARLLRDNGVPNVYQTQMSRDQGADVIVTLASRKIVIQLKQYSADAVDNSAVQQAHAAKGYYQATDAWVATTSLFTKDAADLAYRLGVRLVPGPQLLHLPGLLIAEAGSSIHHAAEVATESWLDQGEELALPSSPNVAAMAAPVTFHSSEAVPQAPVAATHIGVMPPNGWTTDTTKPVSALPRRAWLLSTAILCCVIAAAFAVRPLQQRRTREDSERDIQMLLDTYQAALRTKNLESAGECYAPVVEAYYGWRDVPKERALGEIERAFSTYQSVAKLSLSNVTFGDVSAERAVATFDKEWDFRGPKEFAGKERQEMIFTKMSGRWRIASEKELRVYWVHHRR